MTGTDDYSLRPIGHIRSTLRALYEAPRQGSEGAPDAWLEVDPAHARALHGIAAGDEVIVITWLHRADRNVVETHPRNDPRNPLAGVFATRSPDRPNPLGLHRVTVREIAGTRLRIGPIEAIDGTPVVDIKPRDDGVTVDDMERDQALREHLQKLLGWEDAHAGFDSAIDGIPTEKRGVAPKGLPHSPWQLLEHIRRTQWDILDFCRNPKYVEPKSMREYWPDGPAPPSAAAWDESVAAVRRDREDLKRMAGDPGLDLFGKVPRGTGQTYLREIVLVADHSAYHVGQLVLTRRLLGIWS